MFKLFKLMLPLYDEPDGNDGGGAADTGTGLLETIDFLNDEDNDEVLELDKKKDDKDKDSKKEGETDKDEEVKDEEDEEEVDELEELLNEVDGPDEEKLELVTPVRRKEILKKYPKLFSDFPYLEHAYYREQQFTELLPTIDDAKQAVEKSKTLDKFEAELLKGSTDQILKAVKETDANAFSTLVDDYLPTLARIDPAAYHHVLGNTIKHTIIAMVKESNSSKNEKLKEAAALLNQFVFGSTEFTPPQNLAKEEKKDDKDDKVNKREQEFNQRQFETSRDGLNTKINNQIKSTIERHIDPKDAMGDYVKKNASREAQEMLSTLITKDSRFKTIIDKLWENAFNKSFSQDSLDKIKSAYLTKAKTLLPSVIKKARNDALKGIGKRVKEDKEDTNDSGRKPQAKDKDDSPSNKRGEKITKATDIPKGMSTLDFLSS